MPSKIDISSINQTIIDLDISDVKISHSKSRSSAKFDFTKSHSISIVLRYKILELIYFKKAQSKNLTHLDEELKSSLIKDATLITELALSAYEGEADPILNTINSQKNGIKTMAAQSVAGYFNNHNKIVVNTNHRDHAPAFGVSAPSQIPKNNYLIKIKNFSSDKINVRMGISSLGANNIELQTIDIDNKRK